MFGKHPWDNTYMRSLMKILTFATRLKMKFYTLYGYIEY